ncbi:MAG: AmmeMemoRadiSam system protein A [Planctomycetota bacterium]
MEPHTIPDSDRRLLLGLARQAVAATTGAATLPARPVAASNVVDEARGAFVTLHKLGRLRGCVGLIEPVKPLWLSVRDAATSAASRDPRFGPVTADELTDLVIDISALTPMRKIDSVDEIVVGVHGLYVDDGRRSGLLLPQVPGEWGWDRDAFVHHTLRKAGLPATALESPRTQLYTFMAEVFAEQERD